ncbi:amidase [Nannocystaceae bacterium ST9]
MPEYDDLDATALAALLRQRELSAREVIEQAIARIERRNPGLDAVVHRMAERALADAARVDRELAANEGGLPPLLGVPFLLKDLKAEDAGEPCTNGSRFFRDRRASQDGELVRRFKRAGLIVCGRTNTPEFGIMGVTEPSLYGPTRNPWDPRRTCGGSSGGSAAAVAARMVPLAHGGDGGGSIRIPASHCGLVGLKPTRGRTPLPPATGHWEGFVVEHVLARSVRDSALVLDQIAGPGLGDWYSAPPASEPFATTAAREPGSLRIAWTSDALFGDETHPDCVRAVEDAAKLCERLGHRVVQARPKFDKPALIRAYLITVAAGVAGSMRMAERELDRKARNDELELRTWMLRMLGETISAGEYLESAEIMRRAVHELAEFFLGHDLLLTPTCARPPVEIGELDSPASERAAMRVARAMPIKAMLMAMLAEMAKNPLAPNPNTQLFNMSGQPAISLPLHWNDAGLPIGVQAVARHGEDGSLLAFAAQLEREQPWAMRKPTLA